MRIHVTQTDPPIQFVVEENMTEIRNQKRKKCKECGHLHHVEQNPHRICDQCETRVGYLHDDPEKKEYKSPLSVTVHYHEDEDTKHVDFCSWQCCFLYLTAFDTENVWFVSLPHLSFDEELDPTIQPDQFFECLDPNVYPFPAGDSNESNA